MKVFYTAVSDNPKTGNIPQQFIGGTREESLRSCTGCALLRTKNNCYAQGGMTAVGHTQIINAHKRGKDYSLKNALKHRSKTAKCVRFGAIGDPSAINYNRLISHIIAIKKAGLKILGFTHFWRTCNQGLRKYLLASADDWQGVKDAVEQGWRTALYVQKDWQNGAKKGVLDGVRFARCPSQTRKIPCNDCKLCSLQVEHRVQAIIFNIH